MSNLLPQRRAGGCGEAGLISWRGLCYLPRNRIPPASQAGPPAPPRQLVCYSEPCAALAMNSQPSFHPQPPASHNGPPNRCSLCQPDFQGPAKGPFFRHFLLASPTCHLLICGSCRGGPAAPRGRVPVQGEAGQEAGQEGEGGCTSAQPEGRNGNFRAWGRGCAPTWPGECLPLSCPTSDSLGTLRRGMPWVSHEWREDFPNQDENHQENTTQKDRVF